VPKSITRAGLRSKPRRRCSLKHPLVSCDCGNALEHRPSFGVAGNGFVGCVEAHVATLRSTIVPRWHSEHGVDGRISYYRNSGRPREITHSDEVACHCGKTGFWCLSDSRDPDLRGHYRNALVAPMRVSNRPMICRRTAVWCRRTGHAVGRRTFESGSVVPVGLDSATFPDQALPRRLSKSENLMPLIVSGVC
jgi:hypothetical protein